MEPPQGGTTTPKDLSQAKRVCPAGHTAARCLAPQSNKLCVALSFCVRVLGERLDASSGGRGVPCGASPARLPRLFRSAASPNPQPLLLPS